MKTRIYTADGKEGKEIVLPEFFGKAVRTDLIQKIVEAKKKIQPYGPSPLAGNSSSASGALKHHRKVWKSQYGRGMSRVPRKTMSVRGSQFNWVGATSPNTRGGRRAHPPKILSMFFSKKINKKELEKATISAISATASPKWISKRYESIEETKIKNCPIIVESKFAELKAKSLLKSVKEILGQTLFEVAVKKKQIRAGKGKTRGRKYKSNLGLLVVVGENEKLKSTAFDIVKANTLGINDLAKGGPGRLTIYTENAIKELENKIGGNKK